MVVTDELEIAVEEHGDAGRDAVLLLHGWPDDIRCWDGLLEPLVDAEFHVIVPYLRGFGATRFRRPEAMRSGQLTALAGDVLALADGLGLDRFAVVGHDWGARAAYLAAALAPHRVTACVAMSVGWGTNSPDQELAFEQAQNYWYHWLMALPRGEQIVREQRREFTRYIWDIWMPERPVGDADFAATAVSFDNPDWAAVTLHSYRVRWGLAEPDPRYSQVEARVAASPVISVPTLVLHGGADPCNAPSTSARREVNFAGPYRRVVLDGVGHFPQRTAAAETLAEVVPFLRWYSAATPRRSRAAEQ